MIIPTAVADGALFGVYFGLVCFPGVVPGSCNATMNNECSLVSQIKNTPELVKYFCTKSTFQPVLQGFTTTNMTMAIIRTVGISFTAR